MTDITEAASIRLGGRPSKEEAERLGEKILDVATGLFLMDGYEKTSIESVARGAGISKRTFYHRFQDKGALFAAVVHRIIENLRPAAGPPLYAGENAEQVLRRLASLMVHAAVMPSILALQRLILAEARRFPELAVAMAQEAATVEAIKGIAALLEGEVKTGRMKLTNTEFAALQFMQLVVAIPQRRALGLGTPMTPAERDAWASDSTTLFLNGCRA
jgi:AcrR family transcriptional regulator